MASAHPMHPQKDQQETVGIVGGGFAGLAAALALGTRGFQVELFEAKRHLGGRASSLTVSDGNMWIDQCQHVAMGCCTNFLNFCRQTHIERFLRTDRTLTFVGPDNHRTSVARNPILPAPFHLAPLLSRLAFLSSSEKRSIGQTLFRLARLRNQDLLDRETIGQWLINQHQTSKTIDQFWSTILVSALGERLDRASLSDARKVFVDGFMAHRRAYELQIPTIALTPMLNERVGDFLRHLNIQVHRHCPAQLVRVEQACQARIEFDTHAPRAFDYIVCAVPWHQIADILVGDVCRKIPKLTEASTIEPAPITAVHLWFDRPCMQLAHAILVARTGQWIFRGNRIPSLRAELPSYHYQVVISAARDVAQWDRNRLVQTVVSELAQIWPGATEANLVDSQVVTMPNAVFSVVPQLGKKRPPQETALPQLVLAGDWTATGWPATMEGAVRSGYQAAEAVLQNAGRPEQIVIDDLPRGMWMRWIAGDDQNLMLSGTEGREERKGGGNLSAVPVRYRLTIRA